MDSLFRRHRIAVFIRGDSAPGKRARRNLTPKWSWPGKRSTGSSISFEPNLGQAEEQVKFMARGPGYTLSLTRQGAVFSFHNPNLMWEGNHSFRSR